MKNNTLKYSFIVGFLLFLVACSTRKETFISRNMHALSAEYNILYNGGLALDKGINELKAGYKDNFWQKLPIERMQVNKDMGLPGQTKNANFERAETKAIKAIQKHSMDIDDVERNPQMDEAHLLLGKARYYDQRFIPALEAFNYVLYKYALSDKIYEVKVWREKTNIRMENDALAVINLNKLLLENDFKDQIFADANASLSQAYINLDEIDCATEKLQLAIDYTKLKEERARYRFILGQLYDELGKKDSAFIAYQSVIDMKRKSPKQYVIWSHFNQAKQFDYEKGDTIAFLKKYKKLLKDRENRPFLDVLNHQMGLFYDKNKKYEIAQKYYNKSLKLKTEDTYMMASNYRNLATLYFNKAKYKTSGQYYDSTLVVLKVNSKEYRSIKKKRENLNDVIKYENLVSRNDSILNVVALSESGKTSFYENYIEKLKKEDDLKRILEEKEKKKKVDSTNISTGSDKLEGTDILPGKLATSPPTSPRSASAQADFYFYTASTVAYGKAEFKKNWGERTYKNNWRLSTTKAPSDVAEVVETENNDVATPKEAVQVNEKYTVDYYIKQLPQGQVVIDSIVKERNFSNYQLGSIYKEKFKEYQLAANRFEKLLNDNPEEKLILPSMYNLYKIYEIIDRAKMLAMKEKISSKYPESRYAQIINNGNAGNDVILEGPEVAYNKMYKLFEAGDYRTTYSNVDEAITKYNGEELVSKFELLKANTIGKLKGLEEYKKALNAVSLNYPYSDEGKQAGVILAEDFPKLEKLKLNGEEPKSWKIVYKVDYKEKIDNKTVQDTLRKFITDNSSDNLSLSFDTYTMDENFIVIHNIISEDYAKEIANTLRNDKDYEISLQPIIISSYNYKVVQIKKNLDEFLNPALAPKTTEVIEPESVEPESVPETPVPTSDKTETPPNKRPGSSPLSPPMAEEGITPNNTTTSPKK